MAAPELLTNLTAALLIMGFGIIVGNIFCILIKKILQSFEVERILKDQGIRFPIEDFLGSLVKYVTYIVGLILGLTFLGLQRIVLYIILFIILGLLIGFILLAFKDFVPNFVAGFVLHWKKKIQKGETVQLDSLEGKVVETDMLEVRIKTIDGDIVVIPNVLVARSIVTKKKK